MNRRNTVTLVAFLLFFFFIQPMYSQAVDANSDPVTSAEEKDWEEKLHWISVAASGEYEHADLPKIYEAFSFCIELYKEIIGDDLIFLPEKEREAYAIDTSEFLQSIQDISVSEAGNYPPFAGVAYNCVLLNKGFLLSLSTYVESAKRKIDDPGIKELWEYIDDLKRLTSIQRGYFESSQIKEAYENAKETALLENDSSALAMLDEYTALKNNLIAIEETIIAKEKELAFSLKAYLSKQKDFHVDWRNIRDLLKKGEAAIEFVLCPKDLNDPSGECDYYALLVRPDDPYPQVVRLDAEDHLSQTDEKYIIQTSRIDKTYSLVWKHLEKYLKNITDVYISPVGMLNSISYARVKNDKGEYVTDHYTIHNVISTRDIFAIRNPGKVALSRDVVLFGGADYGLPGEPLSQQDKDIHAPDSSHLMKGLLLEKTRGQGADYLPESEREVREIFQILAKGGWAEGVCYYGDKVTKSRFIQVTEKLLPYIIHISTHGFYFPRDKSDYNKTMSAESNFIRISNNPLMRCGLLFSGANHLWEGNEPVENTDDGILTAYEISQLNLSATRLVVLSACSTGLGDVDYNEGIYGLQRAFRLAGVDSMIVSLRKVPDKETKELMIGFYSYLVSGIGLKKSFDQAQKDMRHKYPENPEKWADFILIE